MNVLETLVVDEFVDFVAGGEGFWFEMRFVFVDAILETSCYACVEMFERTA
jgi:hypothetical protein